jgi:hypothetical protein
MVAVSLFGIVLGVILVVYGTAAAALNTGPLPVPWAAAITRPQNRRGAAASIALLGAAMLVFAVSPLGSWGTAGGLVGAVILLLAAIAGFWSLRR